MKGHNSSNRSCLTAYLNRIESGEYWDEYYKFEEVPKGRWEHMREHKTEKIEEWESRLKSEVHEKGTALLCLPLLEQISGDRTIIDDFLLPCLSDWKVSETSSSALGIPVLWGSSYL